MTTAFNIVFFLEFIFHGYCVYIYNSAVFKNRKTRISPLILYLGASCIEFILYRTFYIVPLNMASVVILTAIISYICYDTKLYSCIFHSAVLSCAMCIIEIMGIPLGNMILNDDYFQTHSLVNELFGSTVTKLIFFTFCKVISRFLEKESKSTKSLFLFCVPVLTLLCSVMVMSLSDYHNINRFYMVVMVFAVSIMIINVVVFVVHENYIKNAEETERLRLLEQKKRLDYEHYRILQESYNNSRILVHDIKHNMNIISAMAENGDIESLKDYVRSMNITSKYISGINITGNKIIDVVIYQATEKCKKRDISFSFNSSNINFSFMNEADICCILSNLLDNAIESAEKSKGKTIDVEFYAKEDRSMLFIEIKNSCDTVPLIKDNKYITSKKEKDKHGIGMYSVKRAVSEYDGFVDFDYDDDKHIFTSVVSVNAPDSILHV